MLDIPQCCHWCTKLTISLIYSGLYWLLSALDMNSQRLASILTSILFNFHSQPTCGVSVQTERIQFSFPESFLGGPGRFSMTSLASCDFSTMVSFSLTAVCMRRTLWESLEKYTTHIHLHQQSRVHNKQDNWAVFSYIYRKVTNSRFNVEQILWLSIKFWWRESVQVSLGYVLFAGLSVVWVCTAFLWDWINVDLHIGGLDLCRRVHDGLRLTVNETKQNME